MGLWTQSVARGQARGAEGPISGAMTPNMWPRARLEEPRARPKGPRARSVGQGGPNGGRGPDHRGCGPDPRGSDVRSVAGSQTKGNDPCGYEARSVAKGQTSGASRGLLCLINDDQCGWAVVAMRVRCLAMRARVLRLALCTLQKLVKSSSLHPPKSSRAPHHWRHWAARQWRASIVARILHAVAPCTSTSSIRLHFASLHGHYARTHAPTHTGHTCIATGGQSKESRKRACTVLLRAA